MGVSTNDDSPGPAFRDQAVKQAQVVVIAEIAVAVADLAVEDVDANQVEPQPLEMGQVVADRLVAIDARACPGRGSSASGVRSSSRRKA